MNETEIENLKLGLKNIILKYHSLAKARQREKVTIEAEIKYFTDKLILDFDLTEYDNGIKEEKHKTNFFIQDVERIIQKEESKASH